MVPALNSTAHAADAWGALNGASSVVAHYTPDPNAVFNCYWSESGPPGADTGAEYQFLSLTPDDGSAPQYLAFGVYTRTGGAVAVHADNVGFEKDTGVLVPPTGANFAGVDQNEVITIRFSDAATSFKAGTLRFVSASWGQYQLYNCSLTDNGVTTSATPLSTDRVAAVPLSAFSGGVAAVAEGGNIALQASAAAATSFTRNSSGYLLALFAPAAGISDTGITTGGDPTSTAGEYAYGGGVGAITATGPEGEAPQSLGETPSIAIAAPTNGPWTYSVTANVAHTSGPALWIAELPS